MDSPIDLDSRRGMAAQKATRLRRLMAEVEADRAALQARQDELERFLLAAPATEWHDAVAKARYLLGLFAKSPSGHDPRHTKLIEAVLADFDRLLDQAEPD